MVSLTKFTITTNGSTVLPGLYEDRGGGGIKLSDSFFLTSGVDCVLSASKDLYQIVKKTIKINPAPPTTFFHWIFEGKVKS